MWLSERLDRRIDSGTVSNWASGKRAKKGVSHESVIAMADELFVQVAWLLSGELPKRSEKQEIAVILRGYGLDPKQIRAIMRKRPDATSAEILQEGVALAGAHHDERREGRAKKKAHVRETRAERERAREARIHESRYWDAVQRAREERDEAVKRTIEVAEKLRALEDKAAGTDGHGPRR